jgi:hypothetical protein
MFCEDDPDILFNEAVGRELTRRGVLTVTNGAAEWQNLGSQWHWGKMPVKELEHLAAFLNDNTPGMLAANLYDYTQNKEEWVKRFGVKKAGA